MNTAFGSELRHFLSRGTRNRWRAFGAGLVATLALQSSTATAVILASFISQGLIEAAMGQAVMLGANVGTALVTQILSFDLHWLAPLFILAGFVVRKGKSRRRRGIGEIALGLGVMLLALKLMGEATEPLRQSEAVAAFFGLMGEAPLIAMLLAAALAAISASSLAVVLFIMAIAAAGSIDASLCMLLVAGANVGGAIPPLLAVANDGLSARQVVVGNLVARAAGSLLLMIAVDPLASVLPPDIDVAALAIQTHLGFNIALAALLLPFVRPLTALVARFMPTETSEAGMGPRHLDQAALSYPPSAIAAAMRETLRVGDIVEEMLETTLRALKTNDEILCQDIFRLDDQVDSLQGAIKLYIARVERTGLDEAGRHQLDAILAYAVNLEHIGDVIERSLSRLTLKKIEKQLRYSPEGMAEIEEVFEDTINNLQLAQLVFINRDHQLARRLMEAKVAIRNKEKASVGRHMARLQQRRPETLQTTSMHMDVLRDLKRINSHIVSVATPILEEAGLLRESRLKKS